MQILKSAVTYFAVVFGAGFLLGTIRVLVLVPRFGNRTAELLEMPLMLLAIVLAASWLDRSAAHPAKPSAQVSIGLIALGLLLLAEIAVGVGLRGLSLGESLINPDPVSGTIYYVMLGVFAFMPWLLTYRKSAHNA